MKKYNAPEIKISTFNIETVLTDSAALAAFNDFTQEAGTQSIQYSWTELQDKMTFTF